MNMMKKGLYSSIFLAVLMSPAFAGHAVVKAPAVVAEPGKAYIGVFGGGGASNRFDTTQFGSAFFFEELGGALAVNAFGHSDSESSWLAGGQIGYQTPSILLDAESQWMLVPAGELEAYYIGNRSYNADLINDTARLEAHDFDVSYSMRRSVFLVNAVLNYSNPCYLFHPYIGVGFGGALVKIRNADSTQIDPPEEGVNHFNASTSDLDSTFAGQIKVGLSYDINKCVSLFAEYRWLYIAPTHFTLGSTVYPDHAETSPWLLNLSSQHYNLGTVGIRLNMM